MSSSFSIEQKHIDGTGKTKFRVYTSLLSYNLDTYFTFRITGSNYYRPTTTYSNILVESEYTDSYHTKILNTLTVESFDYGMYFCIYTAKDWEYLTVTPSATYSYDGGVFGHYFENLVPRTYVVTFSVEKGFFYALKDITDDYIDDPGFEDNLNQWQNAHIIPNQDFTSYELSSTYFHSGSSSLKLTDTDTDSDYFDLIIPNFVVKNLYVSFWYFTTSNMGGAEQLLIRAYTWGSTPIEIGLDVSTSEKVGKWIFLGFKVPLATTYTSSADKKVLSFLFAGSSGTVHFDDLRFYTSNAEIKTIGFENGLIEYEFQATMINWDGRGYGTLPYLNVDFILYNSIFDIVYQVTVVTDADGYASYRFSDFEFNSSETYILYCISYETKDGCSLSEKHANLDHYWSIDDLITNDYAEDIIGGSAYNAGHGDPLYRPSHVEGRFRNAWNFTNTGGLTQHTYHLNFQKDGQDWSVSFWYKVSDSVTSATYWMGDTTDYSNSFRCGQYSDPDHYWLRTECAYGDSALVYSDKNNDGEWTHILISMDLSDAELSFYENGLYIGSDTLVDTTMEFENFGSGYNGATYYSGIMDDIRYFDGEVTLAESRETMYLHSAQNEISGVNLTKTIEVYETESHLVLTSTNDSLVYAIWMDETYLGLYADLDFIPKDITTGTHNFTYFPIYDLLEDFIISEIIYTIFYIIADNLIITSPTISIDASSGWISVFVETNWGNQSVRVADNSSWLGSAVAEGVSFWSTNTDVGVHNISLVIHNGVLSDNVTLFYLFSIAYTEPEDGITIYPPTIEVDASSGAIGIFIETNWGNQSIRIADNGSWLGNAVDEGASHWSTNTNTGLHNLSIIIYNGDISDNITFYYVYTIAEPSTLYTLAIFRITDLQGIGLPFETCAVYINGTLYNHSEAYCQYNSYLEITVKDWFGNLLLTTNATVIGIEQVIILPVPLIEVNLQNTYEIPAQLTISTANYNVSYWVSSNQTISIRIFSGIYNMKSVPYNETWTYRNGTHEITYEPRLFYSASISKTGINISFKTTAKSLISPSDKDSSKVPNPFQFLVPFFIVFMGLALTALTLGSAVALSRVGWSGVKRVMNIILVEVFNKKYVEPAAGKIMDAKKADRFENQFKGGLAYRNYQPKKR